MGGDLKSIFTEVWLCLPQTSMYRHSLLAGVSFLAPAIGVFICPARDEDTTYLFWPGVFGLFLLLSSRRFHKTIASLTPAIFHFPQVDRLEPIKAYRTAVRAQCSHLAFRKPLET